MKWLMSEPLYALHPAPSCSTFVTLITLTGLMAARAAISVVLLKTTKITTTEILARDEKVAGDAGAAGVLVVVVRRYSLKKVFSSPQGIWVLCLP